MTISLLIKTVLLIGHVIGVALGAGGATMSDVLFMTSIQDNKIDRSELKLLKIASKVVVAGLCLLLITGLGFFLVGGVTSPRFWAKMTIVAIAALNGFIMHRKLFPIFEQCADSEAPLLAENGLLQHAPILLVAGSISAVSWYSALILGMWRTLSLSYFQIIWGYGLVVLVAIAGAAGLLSYALNRPILTKHLMNKIWDKKPA